LPGGVREIGDVGNVPDAPAIHSVAPNAIPVEEVHDDPPLLLGASHPVPYATGVDVRDVTRPWRMVLFVLAA
jgi:hypothetical protein